MAPDPLQTKLVEFIEQAVELRFKFNLVDISADPITLHNSLVAVQETLSELESLLSKSMRAKASLDRRTFKARSSHQEMWDRAISVTNNRPTLSEYATGKEKAAEANLATLESARTLRREEEMLSYAVEAVEIIRLHYYALDKIRQDIRKRLDFSQTDLFNS